VSRFRAAFSLLLAAAWVTTPARAHAGEKETCLRTYVEGQAHRKDGKLVAAREALLVCARSVCPNEIRADCAGWLMEVEASLPTLVISATDEHGENLATAQITIDGVASASTLGKAVSVDPGEHVVRLQAAGKKEIEKRVVAVEGVKNQAVKLGYPLQTPNEPTFGPVPAPLVQRPTPTSFWILSAVAVASVAVATGFGASAVWGSPGYKSLEECRPRCAPDDVSAVDRKLRIADVALGIGVLSASAAVVLYLTRPSQTTNVGLAPFVVHF